MTIYMQMGGNAGEGPVLARQIGASAAAQALGVDKLNAQFSSLGAGDDDQPVQGSDRRQAELHRHHGTPRRDAFHDLVKQAEDQGIVVTDGNSPLTAAAAGIRREGLRLCRRRSLCRRLADRSEHDRQGRLKAGRRGDGLRRVQPGRARPVGEGSRRHAGEGRPQGRPARHQPGSQQRRRPRRAGAHRLRSGASEPEGDRHASTAA